LRILSEKTSIRLPGAKLFDKADVSEDIRKQGVKFERTVVIDETEFADLFVKKLAEPRS